MFSNSSTMKPELPIKSLEEDELGFEPFVVKVSEGIKSYVKNHKECYVVSVEGPWGSGKTSFINMVKEQINDDLTIMNFNPWLISDIEQLIGTFFNDFITTLNYVSFKSKWDNDIKEDIKKFSKAILPNTVSIGITKDTKATWKFFENKQTDKLKTIYKQKVKINEYLRDLEKPILIVIDDIDRLMDKEVELVFRLIKGIADFDNVIYLLMFDRKIVSSSLEKFKSELGEQYLDKIIQYPLTLPKSMDYILKDTFTNELNKFLKTINDVYTNDIKWKEFIDIFPNYVKNIRDVKKLISTFSFEIITIYENVNIIDFLVLTLLRLKNFDLYELVKNKPNLFIVEHIDNVLEFTSMEQNTSREKVLKERFVNLYPNFKDFIPLLGIIFPSFIGKYKRIEFESQHQEKSINDLYYHEYYFTMSVPEYHLTTKELNELSELLINDVEKWSKEIFRIYPSKAKQFQKSFLELNLVKDYEFKDTFPLDFLKNIKIFIKSDYMNDEKYADGDIEYYSWIRFLNDIIVKNVNLINFILSKNFTIDKKLDVLNSVRFLESHLDDVNNTDYSELITEYKNSISAYFLKLKFEDLLKNFDDWSALYYNLNWLNVFNELINDEFREQIYEYCNQNIDNLVVILEKFLYKQISMPQKELPFSVSLETLKHFYSKEKWKEDIEDNVELQEHTKGQKIIQFWKQSKDW